MPVGYAVKMIVTVVVERASDEEAALDACTDTIVQPGHQWYTEDGRVVTIIGASAYDVIEVEV